MLFKLSNLYSNLALTLGYLNTALNNSALIISPGLIHLRKGVLGGSINGGANIRGGL